MSSPTPPAGPTLHEAELASGPSGGLDPLRLAIELVAAGDADRMVAGTIARFGKVDIIVNAVGGGAGKVLHPAEEYPREDWDWIMELNVRSTIVPTMAAVRSDKPPSNEIPASATASRAATMANCDTRSSGPISRSPK